MNFTKSSMPIPALTRLAAKGESKYNFDQLAVGECITTTDFVDAKKAAARLTSAVASYRKRAADKRVFSVRTFKDANGVDAVGVWVVAAAPAVTAEVSDQVAA